MSDGFLSLIGAMFSLPNILVALVVGLIAAGLLLWWEDN